jgi:hypothetical protein
MAARRVPLGLLTAAVGGSPIEFWIPCGTFTPFSPQTGAGGECTCPASRCAVNASRVLRYPIRFGDDAAAAPCVAGVAPENAVACNGDRGSTPCKSQKWLLTPAPEDKVACQAVLTTAAVLTPATVSQTCVWAAAPTPAPAKPTPAPTPCGTPSGRPCAPAFNPLDLTGLWMMADTGPASQGMLWAQQAKPPSCFAGACSGATYTFTCLTGNYSAGSPFSTGDGCPWSTVACAVNADEEPYPGDYVSCLFGGATGGTDVLSVLLDGGTLLGAHPDFPGSGVGWRRLTGKMTGLWSAVDDNATAALRNAPWRSCTRHQWAPFGAGTAATYCTAPVSAANLLSPTARRCSGSG